MEFYGRYAFSSNPGCDKRLPCTRGIEQAGPEAEGVQSRAGTDYVCRCLYNGGADPLRSCSDSGRSPGLGRDIGSPCQRMRRVEVLPVDAVGWTAPTGLMPIAPAESWRHPA